MLHQLCCTQFLGWTYPMSQAWDDSKMDRMSFHTGPASTEVLPLCLGAISDLLGLSQAQPKTDTGSCPGRCCAALALKTFVKARDWEH